jgi:MFS family permease
LSRAVLRNRDFLLLFAGQGISRLGDGLYTAAVAWIAWTLSHDPASVAFVIVAANLPTFFATVIGASYADRYDRRKLMIATDLGRFALVALAPPLLLAGALDLTVLMIGAALLSLIGAPFAPARNALVPRIVPPEKLVEANGLLQVAFRSAYFVGPLLLAPLLAFASMPVVLAIDALTFLASAATLARLHVPHVAAERIGLRADLAAGFAVLRETPDVMVVIGTFVLALVAASGFLTVGVVALVGERLDGQGGEYGLLLGIAGIAEVGGALAVARLPLRNLALTAVLAWAVLGAFRFPLGLAATPLAAGALLAVTGFASALTDIPLVALVQRRIPDRHLAKVFGLWEGGIAGAVALAPVIAAFLIAHVGVRTGFMLSGVALIALSGAAALTLARAGALRPAERPA